VVERHRKELKTTQMAEQHVITGGKSNSRWPTTALCTVTQFKFDLTGISNQRTSFNTSDRADAICVDLDPRQFRNRQRKQREVSSAIQDGTNEQRVAWSVNQNWYDGPIDLAERFAIEKLDKKPAV
jgi:hypothetical protein